jgi:hypothetical protein
MFKIILFGDPLLIFWFLQDISYEKLQSLLETYLVDDTGSLLPDELLQHSIHDASQPLPNEYDILQHIDLYKHLKEIREVI